MNAKLFKAVFSLVSFMVLVSLACSSGSTPTPAPTALPAVTEAPLPEATQPPPTAEPTVPPEPTAVSGAVTGLDQLEMAVVDIVAEGTYIDPYEGWQVNVGRGGSGFIIDPSGIAITNNHIVTGAALLKVYVAGEEKPRNAKVLGVSECSDLAVIDIDGDGFSYLEWFDGEIKAGMTVYAAGFPVSAAGSDFSLTQGIVSKPNAALDSIWASVSAVVEHTAKLNQGNSGGSLVNANGQLVGVNYASVASTDQNYAVSRSEAQKVIAQLRAGSDIDSIGVNGVAVSGDLSGNEVTGIWVRSVKSGSPADKARIQAGDIIVQLESQVLLDASFKDYCSVLRTHSPGDTLAVTVIRSGDMGVYEGQINGRELEFSYALGSGGGVQTGGVSQEDLDRVNAALDVAGVSPSAGQLAWFAKEPITLASEGYMGADYLVIDPELKAADFVFYSDITWETSGGVSGCKVVFRSEEDIERGKQLQFFFQRLSGMPSWNVQVWERGNFQSNLGSWVVNNLIKDKNNTTNTIQLVVKGKDITVYINGARDRKMTDNSSKLVDGIIAIMAWQQSGNTTCAFENSWVWVFSP